jgi:hypothetical protein
MADPSPKVLKLNFRATIPIEQRPTDVAFGRSKLR